MDPSGMDLRVLLHNEAWAGVLGTPALGRHENRPERLGMRLAG